MKLKLKDLEHIGTPLVEAFGYVFTIYQATDISDAAPEIFAKLSNNPTLEAVDGDDAPAPEGGDDKAAVMAELKALGVEFHHRTGIDKLRAMLAEALEKDAA
jgi:hypothetical protein